MKSKNTTFITFVGGAGVQFRVPIYQREYDWGEKECIRLWNDVERIAGGDEMHFIGTFFSVPETQQRSKSKWKIMDGQQRITTLSLMLYALSRVKARKDKNGKITPQKIRNYFLFNSEEKGEDRFKLILGERDNDTYRKVIQHGNADKSTQMGRNYELLYKEIYRSNKNLDDIYDAIAGLAVISAVSDETDKPQKIYESLNDTGIALTNMEKIKNFIFMDMEDVEQKKVYESWKIVDDIFRSLPKETSSGFNHFNKFIKYYLSIKYGENIPGQEIYEKFKECWNNDVDGKYTPDEFVLEMNRYAMCYQRLVSKDTKFGDPDIDATVEDLNNYKTDTCYPLLLKIFDHYRYKGEVYKNNIKKEEIIQMLLLVESYLFRRNICGLPTTGLNRAKLLLNSSSMGNL